MENQSQNTRLDQKAGTWYNGQKEVLQKELQEWLQYCGNSQQQQNFQIKSLIGPHAGLRFCGQTGAYAYQYLKPKKNLKVFLLGPSHHSRMECCGISQFKYFNTPLGKIQLDTEIIKKLNQQQPSIFQYINQDVDENEHSLELHLPWIQYCLGKEPFQLIPIMVGQIDQKQQQQIGSYLAQYYDNDNTVFIFSSDFCHWGERFRYQYYDKNEGEIWQSIQKNDEKAVKIIQSHNSEEFNQYLQQTKNTICGRRPIGIFLEIFKNSKLQKSLETQYLHYDQSKKCTNFEDSSVSYAALITHVKK